MEKYTEKEVEMINYWLSYCNNVVYIIITEDLFSRSWGNDTVSEIYAVYTDKQEALTKAKQLAKHWKLGLDTDGDDVVNYWDDDEGATFIKVVKNVVS